MLFHKTYIIKHLQCFCIAFAYNYFYPFYKRFKFRSLRTSSQLAVKGRLFFCVLPALFLKMPD